MKRKFYCIDCGKQLSRYAIYDKSKRCKKCWYEFMKRAGILKGKNNGCYIDGRTLKKYYCIECKKRIHYGNKRCNKCYRKTLSGRENPMFNKKGINGLKLIKHHIDLNRQNNKERNLLFLSLAKHTSLHQKAYEYLVKKKLVQKYLKWFKKNYLNKRG